MPDTIPAIIRDEPSRALLFLLGDTDGPPLSEQCATARDQLRGMLDNSAFMLCDMNTHFDLNGLLLWLDKAADLARELETPKPRVRRRRWLRRWL